MNPDHSNICLHDEQITAWSANNGTYFSGQPDPRKCQAYRRYLLLRTTGMEMQRAAEFANAVSDKRVQWAIERHEQERAEKPIEAYSLLCGLVFGAAIMAVLIGCLLLIGGHH